MALIIIRNLLDIAVFQSLNQTDDIGAADTVGAASAATSVSEEPVPIGTRRADALVEVAETCMNTEPVPNSTADRYQVVVHVSAETSRRIACHTSVLRIDAWLDRQFFDRGIDADTCTPKWFAGGRMDWRLAVENMRG
jgi:hypothetical protein